MTGYRQQKPRFGLTRCPDLVDHYKGILGVHGDTTIFIAKKVQRITSTPEPYDDVYSVMNSDSIFIARHIYRGSEDWIVMTYPYYQVLKVNTRGKPSFW